ncbi:MAG TPA: M1 family metallopeptidase [Kofleriaceae bacterium]|nr:M1 family metallopeptidase [Kofleriaceae bacterium]
MRMCFVALVVLAACSAPIAPVKSSPGSAPAVAAGRAAPVDRGLEPPAPALRLPRNFLPTGYTATLAVDPAVAGFTGTIAIAGEVAQRSSVIWLHGRDLVVARASASRDGAEIALTATPHGGELLELRAAAPLDPGAWTLAIDYTGSYDLLNTTGAFKQVVNGAPYVYSQFEALYARRVFPCFDEPDSKVPWQLTLDVPGDLVAVSNTPIASERPLAGGRKRVAFVRTRPLPSYLIAFGVGPFDVIDAGATRGGAPVRIVAMKGRGPEAAWAARTTAKLLDLLEEFFGAPYPYDKMDMLAIPVTVGFGAMENAGLITFTETLMLLDPKHASREREYTWISVASHELAHQWFGDLVTMRWWDDIWLNEGFANWVEHKITARFAPDWHEELAVGGERAQALGADSLVSARQIRQPIATPDDILNAFDSITYDKGSSVLNMFEGYLGHDVFLRGVRDYVAQHRFGNATSTEFAAAISAAAGTDISAAFASFLEQAGAPEITATLVCDRDRPPRLALSQQRYLPPGSPPSPATRPWIVPVCVAFDRAGKRGEACGMLSAPTGELELAAPACPRWVMPNLDGRGYYRVAYTAPQVTALRDQAWPQLAPTERRALYVDAANAAKIGKLPLALALSFAPKQLAVGDRFSVVEALAVPLDLRRLIPDELRPRYEAWLRRTFGAAAHKAGLSPRDGDSIDVEAVRNNLIFAVGDVGREPGLAAAAVVLAEHWRDLPQGIRETVVSIAVDASPATFDRLFKAVFGEADRGRRTELINALASVRDLTHQAAALGLALDDRLDIRDTAPVLFGSAEEPNRVAAQRFFQDHKDQILKRIPSDGTATGQAWLSGVFTASCSAERRDEIVDYVTRTFAGMPGGARTVKQAIEAMDQCIAQRKLIEPEIRGWLAGGGVRPVGRPAGAVNARR